jgi:NADH-quinone oxidoreductase subunit C
MKAEEIAALLTGQFGTKILEAKNDGLMPWSVVEPAEIQSVCCFLHDDGRLKMDHLECLSGVDYKDRFAVAYHLHSMSAKHRIGVKVFLPKDAPSLPSVDAVWPAANFMEREAYDMFGIVFEGSKDLRRILLPEDWEGHPLRKDYKYPEFYHGIKV